MNRTPALAAAGLAAMLLAAPAIAQAPSAPSADGPRVERDGRGDRHERRGQERVARDAAVLNARVSAGDAIRAVEAAGFRGVTEVEWERGVWEIDAQNAAGARVKLIVDSTTGAMVQQQRR